MRKNYHLLLPQKKSRQESIEFSKEHNRQWDREFIAHRTRERNYYSLTRLVQLYELLRPRKTIHERV